MFHPEGTLEVLQQPVEFFIDTSKKIEETSISPKVRRASV